VKVKPRKKKAANRNKHRSIQVITAGNGDDELKTAPTGGSD